MPQSGAKKTKEQKVMGLEGDYDDEELIELAKQNETTAYFDNNSLASF